MWTKKAVLLILTTPASTSAFHHSFPPPNGEHMYSVRRLASVVPTHRQVNRTLFPPLLYNIIASRDYTRRVAANRYLQGDRHAGKQRRALPGIITIHPPVRRWACFRSCMRAGEERAGRLFQYYRIKMSVGTEFSAGYYTIV